MVLATAPTVRCEYGTREIRCGLGRGARAMRCQHVGMYVHSSERKIRGKLSLGGYIVSTYIQYLSYNIHEIRSVYVCVSQILSTHRGIRTT